MTMPLARRLRCQSCRRSSVNRGSCEHERAVLLTIEKVDRIGMVGEENHEYEPELEELPKNRLISE